MMECTLFLHPSSLIDINIGMILIFLDFDLLITIDNQDLYVSLFST